MTNINDYKHIVEIDFNSIDKNGINKNFDKLLDDSPLSGLNSHYIDTDKQKLYLSFNHYSSKPEARLKTILKGFNLKEANHMVYDNIRNNETSIGKISIKKARNFSLSKGLSSKEIIKSDKRSYIKIKDGINAEFNQIKNKIENISSKSNQADNTLFLRPETIENLTHFNKLKLNHFLNNPPQLCKEDNINKLKEVFKPYEILNNRTVLNEIAKEKFNNVKTMVAFGYKAPEELINNISKTKNLTPEKKEAFLSVFKDDNNLSKTTDKIKSHNTEKSINIDKPKDRGMSI